MPYQFTAKLYLVPFEPIQREIVRCRSRTYRLLLYRRMMLRIAERIARKKPCPGDHRRRQPRPGGFADVCRTWWRSVRLRRCPFFVRSRGTTNRKSWPLARRIGTFEFPRSRFTIAARFFCRAVPALYASAADLEQAETGLDVSELVKQAMDGDDARKVQLHRGPESSVPKP